MGDSADEGRAGAAERERVVQDLGRDRGQVSGQVPGDDDIQGELARLKEEHRDLDDAIEALKVGIVNDQLQIQRLKKRKLSLRDRIAFIEDQLHPDIIA